MQMTSIIAKLTIWYMTTSNPESDEKVNFLKDFNNEYNKGKTSLEKLQSRIWWKSYFFERF